MLNELPYESHILAHTKKRKLVFWIELLLLLLFIQTAYILISSPSEGSVDVRFIANSNSTTDQQEKEEVATVLQPTLPILMDELKNEPNEWTELSVDFQSVKGSYQSAVIPPKLVDYTFIPQRQTNALVFQIGEGRGDNFWCLLFEKSCNKGKKIEKKKMKWWIVEWWKSRKGDS